MSHGYPFASLVAAVSCYVDLSAVLPGWLAGVVTVHVVCAVLFAGLLRHEIR
ncbi:hypothetical protein WBP06_13920 [Novosphingobium sp. BL-8H]|uniref:hypothetical protein n=1 Tax=Novosphingobium sp. BL-8H TaxID=3127640 RepID=UPI0037581D69